MLLRLPRRRFGLHSGAVNSQNIESVLVEKRRFPPSEAFTAGARLKPADVAALREEAAHNYKGFWATQAQKELRWHKPFSVTLDESHAPNYRWFTDGELNVSHNCLDVHLEERGHKTAVTFVGEPGDVRHVSYRELHADVCRFANALKARGVQQGDRVVARRAFGLASLEHRVPNAPTHRFHIASVTKTFVGAALAMLAHQGRIDLDADARGIIPELAVPGPITLRRLVGMTAGLRDAMEMMKLRGVWYRYPRSEADLMALALTQTEPIWLPSASKKYGFDQNCASAGRSSRGSFLTGASIASSWRESPRRLAILTSRRAVRIWPKLTRVATMRARPVRAVRAP